ncbi:type II secretion system protein [Aquincola sp. S2]|uniref:Type II secretion system protein n=1 Tax=Pseudaquabacterium terrae TaxID=2732868 RepID=A0ABX2EJR0_9BURK|nr:type II secretion system protein [Aquabacterium terrae]NRF68882.1 type II secretion system protein [Aquabacterium terrae]
MKPQRRGFSLVELLAVLAILATLASIGVPLAELAQQRRQEEALREALRELRDAIDRYKRLADEGHIVRAADGSGYPPRLELLVEGIVDAKSPEGRRIYLLRRLPRDPFAPAETAAAASWGQRSYASPPDDPRPGADVFDIHSLSPKRGLDGRPYRTW